jgi:hypothetical protein
MQSLSDVRSVDIVMIWILEFRVAVLDSSEKTVKLVQVEAELDNTKNIG